MKTIYIFCGIVLSNLHHKRLLEERRFNWGGIWPKNVFFHPQLKFSLPGQKVCQFLGVIFRDQISRSYCGKGESLLWPATWDEGALKGREGDQRSQIWATHYSAIFSFRESFSRTGIQPKQRETSTKSLWLPKRVYFIICHVVLYLRWMWTEFNWCINRGWSSIGCHRLLRVLS